MRASPGVPSRTRKRSETPKAATHSDGGTAPSDLDKRELLAFLTAFRKGDFRVRMAGDLVGIDGKIADTLNGLIELHAALADELRRLSRVVGEEGRTSQRASLGAVSGAESTDSAQGADILVVDDRQSQRQALSAVVEGLGANVIEAESGREALRLLLQRDFAVILLDVDMPGMDGFETASLIRQRRQSEHTPIIFVTAFGDDAKTVARGYELGAVDFILAPVDPNILRTKVSVFVELYRRTEEATRYARTLHRHASQLRRLAEVSLQVHSAPTIDALLEIVADAAASLIGTEQVLAVAEIQPAAGLGRPPSEVVSRHVVRRPPDSVLDALPWKALSGGGAHVVRLSREELDAYPDWVPAAEHGTPPRGWLAAPLTAPGGAVLGAIQLSDKQSGEFTSDDEAILVQVARIASIALENTVFKKFEEENRLKDQFLGTLSHELRTPLQAMLSWTRILREEDVDAELLARGLDVIERSASTQRRLIDDLLDVSRIMANKMRLDPQPLLLAPLVEAAVDAQRPLAEAKRISIECDLGRESIALVGDAQRLQQVLANLLSNAVRFTPQGGDVEVGLRRCGAAAAEIRVVDSGDGIRPEFLPHLFQPFWQADSGSTRVHQGLGIGLAIVRHLVELHGGAVHAESAGEGKGSTFTVRLPISEGDAVASPAIRLAAPGPLEPMGLWGLCILVAEDEADARDCIALLLRRRGAEVIAVGSAREAVAALDRWTPDVLISDIAMPVEDGLSLISRVRQRTRQGRRIPAVALSAYARPEESALALRAGFDLHLAKPVSDEALVAAVRSLVGNEGDASATAGGA